MVGWNNDDGLKIVGDETILEFSLNLHVSEAAQKRSSVPQN